MNTIEHLSNNNRATSADKFIHIRIYALYLMSVILYFLIPIYKRNNDLQKIVSTIRPKKHHDQSALPVDHIVENIEKILLFLKHKFKCKKNYCLRKAIILLYCLRKYNIPASINVGLKLFNENNIVGHCWLSLGREVLYEKNDVYQSYNMLLAQKDNICYWTCS